ncbi:MAG: hypothetical protein JO058_12800 [Alphaproteobacteria bacterium]|nr:hypothetical protein [Alphaproteobacteria bacterium]MBV9154529.1 hypothetical protein [Alphaproteobacteria bacterium]
MLSREVLRRFPAVTASPPSAAAQSSGRKGLQIQHGEMLFQQLKWRNAIHILRARRQTGTLGRMNA